MSFTALPGREAAWSQWTYTSGPYDSPATNGDCAIEFNQTVTYDWPTFCTLMVHEYGHLTGHRHSANPADIMYPVYVRSIPACRRRPATPAP